MPPGSMKVTFFNQPWLAQKYPPGTRLVLHGKFEARNRFRVQGHAPTAEATTGGDAVAHYPATEGLSSTQILALVREHAAAAQDLLDPLDASLRVRERLPDRAAAVLAAHFPDREGEQELGRRRIVFDELLMVQLALLRRRRTRRAASAAPVLDGPRELSGRWLETMLPFPLTGDQQRALSAIDHDIAQPRPMQRLLMGEVGSGKTVVALYAMLRAVDHDFQAAMMAPTETLAEQHFATLAVADAGGGRPRRPADRIDARAAARRPAGEAGQRGAVADRGDPRADRGRRCASPVWGWR